MKSIIDISDLPEQDIKVIQDLIELLKNKQKSKSVNEAEEWTHLAVSSFASDWENEKDSIYDDWQEQYHV